MEFLTAIVKRLTSCLCICVDKILTVQLFDNHPSSQIISVLQTEQDLHKTNKMSRFVQRISTVWPNYHLHICKCRLPALNVFFSLTWLFNPFWSAADFRRNRFNRWKSITSWTIRPTSDITHTFFKFRLNSPTILCTFAFLQNKRFFKENKNCV